MQPNTTNNENKKLSLSLDYRLIIILLLIVIVAMLFVWKPWQAEPNSDSRTVQVTGDAKVSAEPDEYVFYPTYSFTNADKAVALAELNKKSEIVVAELKKIGVPDNKIKSNADGYEKGLYLPEQAGNGTTYNLSLTVTLSNKELAQKVQDYLVSTAPTGSVSPQSSFSDEKQKELENKARDEATKDARAKADQSAKNLGYKIGKIKSVSDSNGFGPIQPLLSRGAAQDSSAATSSKLSLQPGENDLSYSVTVTYYIK